jgi:hypothetical protein
MLCINRAQSNSIDPFGKYDSSSKKLDSNFHTTAVAKGGNFFKVIAIRIRSTVSTASAQPLTRVPSSTKARRIAESLLLWDDFGGSDLLDRVRPSSNDGPGWIGLGPPSVPSDRRHGAQWPVWRTQQELDLYRQEGRLRLAANSYAKGLLKNMTNNVIKTPGRGNTLFVNSNQPSSY